MSAEIRPLFRPDAIRSHLTAFVLPPHAEAARPKLQHWLQVDRIGQGRSAYGKGVASGFSARTAIRNTTSRRPSRICGARSPAGRTSSERTAI